MRSLPSTFVLVHGAWHGGWCWHRVADPLRKAGHRVFTPTLTGVGERAHLLSQDPFRFRRVREPSAARMKRKPANERISGH
jgi:hypothetical protein